VKTQVSKALVLLFAALVIQCAFNGPDVLASVPTPLQEDGGFCAILDAVSGEDAPPIQSVLQPFSDETIGQLPRVFPLWSLGQSIDHPPGHPA
jgi:hypothetical protein